MAHRYFYQSSSDVPLAIGNECTLDEKESHHALHVMRLKEGDSIILFDGSGYEFQATLLSSTRSHITVQINGKEKVDRELAHDLVIAMPIPKADRQKFLVEKLTELGVTHLMFIATDRSSVKCNDKTISRLSRLVMEASKQCRRNQLMQISNGGQLKSLLHHESINGFQKLFAHPSGSAGHGSVPETRSSVITIGPEGGFSDEEVDWLKQNQWQCLDLGKTILRMETAAMAAAVLVR